MSALQQVNLLSQDLQRQKPSFSLPAMIMAWSVIVLFFATLQTWGWYQTQKTRDQMSGLEAQQNQVQQQIATMRASTPLRNKQQLEEEINAIQSEVARRRQVLRLVDDRNMGNESGFSPFLAGFSRQYKEGLSLEHFRLLEGGTYVELSGWTRRAELVPGYVQRLGTESSFQDSNFGPMTIERVPIKGQPADVLQFKFGEPGNDS